MESSYHLWEASDSSKSFHLSLSFIWQEAMLKPAVSLMKT